jgi:hypothetical protein
MLYVDTQIKHMRRILSYIQLYTCHGTGKATYRRITNIYKKFAPVTLHDTFIAVADNSCGTLIQFLYKVKTE